MATLMQDPGEKSLSILLSSLTTVLHPETYVFATIPSGATVPPLADIQLFFREAEAITVIVTRQYAQDNKLEYFFPCKMITCNITSSLEAVGFMAVIATRLATLDMGVNPVSGFYHDHLFVPEGREHDAVQALAQLAAEKQQELRQ
ncbi:hypothetical protein NQ176_g5017 [Zarea fungicola]|uniref:Uncharacterized protein n=1 Tax=Zarea fungicola TaxID=93591 RepID=A0ACC1NCH8_9HYPO|nr:hypothetical protein NQ176_g5017 [Lecanicillium fungicola]